MSVTEHSPMSVPAALPEAGAWILTVLHKHSSLTSNLPCFLAPVANPSSLIPKAWKPQSYLLLLHPMGNKRF